MGYLTGCGCRRDEAPYRFRSPNVNFDLYEAELDVRKERRTHKYLATMATVFDMCLCPLMVLRFVYFCRFPSYVPISFQEKKLADLILK
jgi:hypothetical protein